MPFTRHNQEDARANAEWLQGNRYPGHGFVQGISKYGLPMQVFWITEQNEAARNVRLLEDSSDPRIGKLVKAAPVYEPGQDFADEDLVSMHNVMRSVRARTSRGGALLYHVVSNGRQTDQAAIRLSRGTYKFNEAIAGQQVETGKSHITGVLVTQPNLTPSKDPLAAGFSVLHRDSPSATVTGTVPVTRSLRHSVDPGVGLAVQTHLDSADVEPPFRGMPYALPLGEGAKDTARLYWELLDPDTRVAVAVKLIGPGPHLDHHIINALEQ